MYLTWRCRRGVRIRVVTVGSPMDGTVVKTIEHQPIQQRTIRHFSSGRREVDGCSVAAGMLRMPVGRMLLKGRRPAVLLASQGHRDWVRPKGPTAARFGCYDTETHQLPFPSFVFFLSLLYFFNSLAVFRSVFLVFLVVANIPVLAECRFPGIGN